MKILIVDDHPIVRAGLRRLLAAEGHHEIREAANGREALSVYRDERPDLVILDINLPGIGGLEITRRLRIEDAAARILVLSMHADPIYVTRALQAGAGGYLGKNAAPADILEAVAQVSSGNNYIQHELAQELALLSVQAPAHPLNELSLRELEILRLLGEGNSLLQIADTIGLSYKTVANNCVQIKTKLGLARTADLIRFAIQNGIAAPP